MSNTGRNKGAFNPAGNVGWTLWNLSKRISEVIHTAKTARAGMENYIRSGGWSIDDLVTLEALAERLEACAERAQATWDLMRAVQREIDEDLVTDIQGIAVISGGGSRPELRERLLHIYGEGHVSAYLEVLREYQLVVARVEGGADASRLGYH